MSEEESASIKHHEDRTADADDELDAGDVQVGTGTSLLDNEAGESDDNSEVDSLEEDDEDDDEEAIQKVREGFIVDDDDDEDAVKSNRRKKRRKRTSEAPDNDQIDEDDLELIMENSGVRRPREESKFKRLKRAEQVTEERRDTPTRRAGGLTDIFSDDEAQDQDEEGEEDDLEPSVARREATDNILDEFEDFIEEDE